MLKGMAFDTFFGINSLSFLNSFKIKKNFKLLFDLSCEIGTLKN